MVWISLHMGKSSRRGMGIHIAQNEKDILWNVMWYNGTIQSLQEVIIIF